MSALPVNDSSFGHKSRSTPAAVGFPKGWIQDQFAGKSGVRLFYRFYPVPGARHTVIMLHGFGEHSARYEKFTERMPRLSAQYAIMDCRGMGKSEGARGDVGAFTDYLEDVTFFVEHLRRKHGVPSKFILLGHSLGGLIALHWAMKNPDVIKLLILSAPLLGLRFPHLTIPLNGMVRSIAPGFVYRNPVRSRALSHDPAEVAAHRRDPLIVRLITARLLGEIIRYADFLRTQPILSLPFPVHMILPGDERIVDPKASCRFFDRLVAPRKERTILDGFYHEIFNERDQQKAFNVLKTIIEDCV
jgi:lysophospholipase